MNEPVTMPTSSAEIIKDTDAFLEALRKSVPDFGYTAAAAIADALAEEEMLGDMASFRKAVTGVENTIFVSTKAGVRHGPRIKLAVNPVTHFNAGGETASVTFDGELAAGKLSPDQLKQARQFIEANRDVLLDYWEQRISTDELQQRLKSI